MRVKKKVVNLLVAILILVISLILGNIFFLFLGGEALIGYGSSFRCPDNLMKTGLKINESVTHCVVDAVYKDDSKYYCVAVIYPNNTKEILQKDIEGGTASREFKIPSNSTFYVYYNDCKTTVPGRDVDIRVLYYFEETTTTTTSTTSTTTITIYYPSTTIINNESYENTSIFNKPIVETMYVTLNKIIQIIKEFFENIMKNVFRI